MPVPSAVISVTISAEVSIFSKRAFSTFRILPRSGRIAWLRRSRPCLAEPPAESPSTMYSSLSEGSRDWQSASLPGSEAPSSTPFRRTVSRALRAAMRARQASPIFPTTARVLAGGRLLEILPDLALLRVAVQGSGEGGLEPGEVRASLLGVDVVGE